MGMTRASVYCVCILVVLIASGVFNAASVQGLRVASFNIERFGVRAMKDPVRSGHIVNVLKNFDIVLVIEVVDVTKRVIPLLIEALDKKTGKVWSHSASGRLGRLKRYREQYLYIYRRDKVTVLEEYQVSDDVYIRPPYAIVVEYMYRGKKRQVGFMGIHTQPEKAYTEMARLGSTIKQVYKKTCSTRDNTVLITMGDFNADCSYLSNAAEKRLEIFKGGDFDSLVPDSWDTAVSLSKNCSYDRLVVYPKGKYGPRDVSVFSLEERLHITNKEASIISDHYPIRFYLR